MKADRFFSACAIVLAAAGAAAAREAVDPPEGDAIAVLPLRSNLEGDDKKSVDVAALVERVRSAARVALPEAVVYTAADLKALADHAGGPPCAGECDLQLGREAGADLIVSGEVARSGPRFRVALELRAADDGKLLNTISANGAAGEELAGAVARGAVDLFRPIRAVAANEPARPEPPAPIGPAELKGEGEADDEAIGAYDAARRLEADPAHPEAAAAAWRALAQADKGSALREVAAARAKMWDTYAAEKRAFDAQLAKDADRLREVLPESWIAEPMKLELLVRFARTYGVPAARPLAPLFPDDSGRLHAELALGCEAQDGNKCLAMARVADGARDPLAALDWLDKACGLGNDEACGDAGERWLSPSTRDPAKAVAALQRACAANRAPACVRLARAYEEGDGVKTDLMIAADLRDKACKAGDGKSCRRLACLIDATGATADAKANDWLSQGCAAGDERSCKLLQKPAERTPAPLVAAKRGPRAVAPEALPDQQPSRADGKRAFGITMVAVGALAASAAAFIAVQDDNVRYSGYYPRRALFEREAVNAQRTEIVFALTAGAVLSSSVGLAVLLSKPDSPNKVAVSAGPGAVMLSGTLP